MNLFLQPSQLLFLTFYVQYLQVKHVEEKDHSVYNKLPHLSWKTYTPLEQNVKTYPDQLFTKFAIFTFIAFSVDIHAHLQNS